MPRVRHAFALFVALILSLASAGDMLAQERPQPSLWFGLFGGANINLFNGVLHSPSTTVEAIDPAGFTAGNGIGLAAGAMLEFNSGGLLGGNLMLGYDNRAFDADPVGGEDLSVSPAYVSIEPNARINLIGGRLHLLIGPAIAINVSSGFEYLPPDSAGSRAAQVGDLADVRGLVIGGQAGIGYDIPLSRMGDASQIVLTPFAQARLGQGLIDPSPGDNDDLGITSIRLGLQLKIGTRQPQPDVVDIFTPQPVDFDIALRVPNVITDSRTVRETFPMRNYIFFDAGSTELPERYRRLTTVDAGTFREEALVREGTPGGGAEREIRSRQQMNAYYNVLNVVGDRMRRTAAASIRLVGAGGGNAADGLAMAEGVKRYLVDTFAIDARRISTEGQALPPNRSGSGSSSGEDSKMIAAENYRVTIVGPEEIVRPLNITTIQEEPLDNDVVVTIGQNEDVAFWSVDITSPDGETQKFGPFRNTTTARIGAKPLLRGEREAGFIARGTLTMKDGSTLTSRTKEFRLSRKESVEEKTGTRFSILFEFDESRTVQTYEKFLAETVAPSIPGGSTVIIHGHTDLIGTPEYNMALAQRRVDETQKILTRELTRAGKTVTFDTYGFGEDERRAPFDNILPEQRYYNRTVVVEVVPGR